MNDYLFGKRFINLFAYDPDNGDMTGFRRVASIEKYLYLDKDVEHLCEKLELDREEVVFMVKVLAEYKYNGALPREPEVIEERDPEDDYYAKVERAEMLSY